MHIHHDHIGGHCHDHEHNHEHNCQHHHDHDHECCGHHDHDHDHECCSHHDHAHDHGHSCCGGGCQHKHSPMDELTALMKYMISHNAAHARELADLAIQLENAGNHVAYEQTMAAVSDFEKGNLRLSAILASLL